MQRLIFLNRFFFPDHSATSQMLSDLAFHLADSGREVHVVTSRQLYDDPDALLLKEEIVRNVRVHRVAGTRFGRKGLAGRAVDYLSYLVSSYAHVLKLARAGDIVVAKTDPPLLSIIAMRSARQKRARLVNWLQDLYPEVAVRLGVPYLGGAAGSIIKKLRDPSLRFATINVVVGKKMAARLQESGVAATTIRIIPNWCDDDDIVPVPSADNPLRPAWDLESKFVVGYSGNFGRAHEFETILGAAERLRSNTRIAFLFIGGGHSFDALARRIEERELQHMFRFRPYQDRPQLKYSLGVPDLHLLSLRPEVEGLIVPSKFYGIAAAGRPILALIPKDGEFAAPIEAWECGLVIEPGRADELAQAISALADNPSRCAKMGKQARAMLEAEFTRQKAFQRWHDALDRMDARP